MLNVIFFILFIYLVNRVGLEPTFNHSIYWYAGQIFLFPQVFPPPQFPDVAQLANVSAITANTNTFFMFFIYLVNYSVILWNIIPNAYTMSPNVLTPKEYNTVWNA